MRAVSRKLPPSSTKRSRSAKLARSSRVWPNGTPPRQSGETARQVPGRWTVCMVGAPRRAEGAANFCHANLYLPAIWCMVGRIVNRARQSCWVVGLAAGWLAGCTSSPQMKRIDENRDVYEQWPIEMRQAVLDGKVEEGMTPDMVVMAIGKPTEVNTRSGTPSTGDDEVWIYRTGGDTDPGMMMPPVGYPGSYPGYPGY